ncbi:hypothetical protein [Actinoplanes utahensis]|uniref:hypothetical protein n=1 Tax=Actinoplanes utahensis TaxID=1869 RepID=UPI001269E623|nr:hypothetical protein [Actinoplanes utahensis]GIF29603.1 hypothetical protein Aut01nite_25890 [Actinoplanes utahensis]
MSERQGDREALRDALRLIRLRVPRAMAACFETSDQDYVGFVLTELETLGPDDLPGVDAAELQAVVEEVWPLTSSIGWDGVMGEDAYGQARVSLVHGDPA